MVMMMVLDQWGGYQFVCSIYTFILKNYVLFSESGVFVS